MSATNGHECGVDAAAYVLGALEPAEVEAFRRHIEECPACREEVAALEQVVDALPAATEPQPVSKALRRRVMREVRATPKAQGVAAARPKATRHALIRLPLLAGGGAVAVAAAIVAIVLATSGSGGTRVIQASVTAPSARASLHITGGRGELIAHGLPIPPTGRIYEMWVQRGRAQPTPTGTLFSVTRAGSVAVGVPGSLQGVSAVMVTQERAGGSPAPTRAPVIVARVT